PRDAGPGPQAPGLVHDLHPASARAYAVRAPSLAMMEKTKSSPSRATAPKRRRARADDGDAEVNVPGEPCHRRAAPTSVWARRSNPMPGRTGTVKSAPWKDSESANAQRESKNMQAAPDDDPEDYD